MGCCTKAAPAQNSLAVGEGKPVCLDEANERRRGTEKLLGVEETRKNPVSRCLVAPYRIQPGGKSIPDEGRAFFIVPLWLKKCCAVGDNDSNEEEI
jgi:hypothetical protein